MPMFSIITVTLNNIDGLVKTGHSVRAQNADLYEWIVIDGGSEDGTASYLLSKGVTHISEKDAGIYDAMNKGIGSANGDYLLFLNAGDCLCDGVLDMLQNDIKTKAPDLLYGDSYEGQNLKPARTHTGIDWGLFTHHQAIFYKREALGDLRYDTSYAIAADYDLTYRILQNIKTVVYRPIPICTFEPGGISQQDAKTGRREQFLIRRNLGVRPTKNIMVYMMQSVIWGLRCINPGLYWAMKRRSGSSGNNDNAHGQS